MDERERENENEAYYNRFSGTRWEIPRQTPRGVRKFVKEHSLAMSLLVGQPVLGFSPSNNPLVPGQRTLTLNTATLALGGDGAGLHFQRLRRSGGGVKERWFRDGGPVPFHHILDPTGPLAAWSIILSDLIVPTFDAGHARVFFGLGSFNTSNDEASLTGAWWRTNDADLYWTSGLYEGTTSPTTALHETAHPTISFAKTGVATARRLSIEIDAATKTINWYADGVLVDTFTPSVPLGQHGNAPGLLYYGITDAGADASIYHFGGGNQRILTLVPVN